ncbi:Spc7 kinetochore protein-domain-containing protein, partial [Dipodascopsis tothii]|uniref:Spc7 kinetochore protein-domain-containing protein n=1 Tax=Dipodascopsis tothii TaxID=44089 RepID=UPI0034CE7207
MPVRLAAAVAGREQAAEMLRHEEQSLLAKIYSPLKSKSAGPLMSPSRRPRTPIKMQTIPLMGLPPNSPRTLSPLKPAAATYPEPLAEAVADEERVSLTEFLRMTAVQFLEGLDTKRRQPAFKPAAAAEEPSAASCMEAEFLHYPMLELAEFSCRELRENIDEGNTLCERLEAETLVESPEVFREYLAASVEEQAQLCAQFKLIKAFARLQAKGVWYEWRAKLVNGVLASLGQNLAALRDDDAALAAA